MADKEIIVKVTTEADVSSLEDLSTVIGSAKESADELSESLDELSDADLAYLMGEIDDMPEGFYESIEAVDELNDSLGDIDGGGLGDASDSADNLSDSLNNTTESSNELADSMGLIEGAMLLDVANQMGQIGSQAEGMAQDMNSAAITVGQLSTNVGMAEPQMVSLINNISNATFPQSEAMAYVNALNQMGVSADKLGSAATNMDRINDATGIGYTKTLQLTQGLRSVGVEADNLPSSFNAIAYAQANVNGGADTLSMVLKRQASTINEYGLNVDQLVIIMQKLSEQGVQGMKMGSALSDVLKETNGDTQALEQSLGLTAGTLSNASGVTGQYSGQLQALASEEAEHKTWLDQINAAWEDMQLMLSPVLTPMSSLLGMVGQFGQFALSANAIITLAETFGILGGAESTLIPIQWSEAAAGWASIGWIVVAIALGIALGLALIYLYNHSEQFRNAVNWLGGSLQWLAGVLVDNIMGAVNQFSQIVQGIPQALQACLDWAYNLVMSHPLVQALAWLGEQASNAFSAIGLGQSSPGKIVKAMRNELDWTEEAIEKSSLARTTGKLGSDIASSFGNGNLSNAISNINNSSTGNGGDIIINVYGDIDNDNRIRTLVDAVKRDLNWDNSTAGRTI